MYHHSTYELRERDLERCDGSLRAEERVMGDALGEKITLQVVAASFSGVTSEIYLVFREHDGWETS